MQSPCRWRPMQRPSPKLCRTQGLKWNLETESEFNCELQANVRLQQSKTDFSSPSSPWNSFLENLNFKVSSNFELRARDWKAPKPQRKDLDHRTPTQRDPPGLGPAATAVARQGRSARQGRARLLVLVGGSRREESSRVTQKEVQRVGRGGEAGGGGGGSGDGWKGG